MDFSISAACSEASTVRTLCSRALSAMVVASATVMALPPATLHSTSCSSQNLRQ